MSLNPHQFEGLARQLSTSGGFTIDPRTGNQPSSGVSVAIPGREVTHAPATARSIGAYAGANADALARPGHHLGGWRNEDDGNDYLDVSKVVPEHPRGHHIADVHHAMHVNRQIASFDLSSAKEIPNPRYSDYTTSEKEGGFTPADEHGSSMRIMRPATPRPGR